MKTLYLYFICIFFLLSCSDNIINENDVFEKNIIGKWNIIKYTDIDGNESQTAYTIFIWYEDGIEFINENQFYPRHNNLDNTEWSTDYNSGPGEYKILSDTLVLTFESYSIKYGIEKITNDSLKISNLSNEKNPWKGIWSFIKE